MEMARTEKIHNLCKPNALTTLVEYAVDYGDERLLEKIEKFTKEQASTMIPSLEKFVLKNIEKLKEGERDLYL